MFWSDFGLKFRPLPAIFWVSGIALDTHVLPAGVAALGCHEHVGELGFQLGYRLRVERISPIV
ncbi:unnamed protein product [Prunus armeniaca]